MSSDHKSKDQGAPMWIARLVSFALVALLLFFFARAWISGILGCAGMFEHASYEDKDEQAQAPEQTPIPPLDQFSDSAYDQVYPDLVEPTIDVSGYAE